MAKEKSVTERILSAGERAVDELIKVLNQPILNDGEVFTDLAADKMKNAAAAKRLAFEDALSITERIEKERTKILDGQNPEKVIGNESFAEKHARGK